MGLCRSSQDWGSEIYNSRRISQRGWKASLSWCFEHHLEVSWNGGTPKSSILIGFSTINNPFWATPIYGNPHFTMLKWPLSRKNNFMFDQFWTYPYHPIYLFNLERPQTFTFDLRYIHAVILLPEKSNIYWPGTRVSKIWWFLYTFMNFGACNSCWSTFDLLFIFVAGYLRLDALKQAIANSPRDHLDQERPWRTSRRSSRWPVIQTHIDIHWHQFFNWYMRI